MRGAQNFPGLPLVRAFMGAAPGFQRSLTQETEKVPGVDREGSRRNRAVAGTRGVVISVQEKLRTARREATKGLRIARLRTRLNPGDHINPLTVWVSDEGSDDLANQIIRWAGPRYG
jgi:hypothetical protein